MEYKSYRIVDGKPKWVIVDENGKIIDKNPSKERLLGLNKHFTEILIPRGYYNDTNTCDRCRQKGKITRLHVGNAFKEYDIEDNWNGKWNCRNCYDNFNIFSWSYMRKSLRDRRTNNQDQNSTNAKGDRFEELSCRWRSTISAIPVKNLNKELDCYNTPIDHTPDTELGIIQTRGKLYDSYNQIYGFGSLENERYKKFDNLICYCTSKDGKTIERIYIFPYEKVAIVTSITIYNNPTNTRGTDSIVPWYEQYRIKDEDILNKVNDIWKEMNKEK